MDVLRREIQVVVKLHIGRYHIAVTQQRAPGSARYGRRVDDDKTILGGHILIEDIPGVTKAT